MFSSIISFFNVILYRPLFNLLILFYDYIPGHDFGVAIIALTILIRVILFPIAAKAIKSQRALQKLQPKIQEAQKKYKDDKEKQAKEILEIYQQEKINPFSGVLLLIIQLPILIALYRVFWGGLNPKELTNLYHFVLNPVKIHFLFLGVINLAQANIYLALVAGAVQFFQTKMLLPKTSTLGGKNADMAQVMQKQMTYVMPVFTVIILLGLPSALGLYWIASGLFSVAQQYFILYYNQDDRKK